MRVCVLIVGDAFSAQARVELLFLQQFCFIKPFKRVHVFVRVDAFLQQELPLVFFRDYILHNRELFAPLNQLVQAALHKIHTVDESQIPQ